MKRPSFQYVGPMSGLMPALRAYYLTLALN